MSPRHRYGKSPQDVDPRPTMGALAAASLDRSTAQALGRLAAAWFRSLPTGLAGPGQGCLRPADPGMRGGLRAYRPAASAAPSHWTVQKGSAPVATRR